MGTGISPWVYTPMDIHWEVIPVLGNLLAKKYIYFPPPPRKKLYNIFLQKS